MPCSTTMCWDSAIRLPSSINTEEMKYANRIRGTVALGLLVSCASAQVFEEATPDLQGLTDEFFSPQEADADDQEDRYENLMQILAAPHDLNTISAGELRALHILDDEQIQNLLTYRDEQDSFLDVHELQVIPGFELSIVSRLLPFVHVRDPQQRIDRSLAARVLSPNQGYWIVGYDRTLEKKKGFLGKTADYKGSPYRMYSRLRTSVPGDFSFGITVEKDAGERITVQPASHQWGFDFTSFHLQLQNKGVVKNIILGDFQTQFGQGLLLGGAFGLGKGGESVSTARRSNLGFLPYTSMNESAYQRGLALTLQPWKRIVVSAFYSSTFRDATFDDSGDALAVSSFQSTGYHRTARELDGRKNVAERHLGTVVHVSHKRLEAGAIFQTILFDVPIIPTSVLYNQHAFRGSKGVNAGLFLDYRVRNLSFFGEAARSRNGGVGAVMGLLLSVHRKFDVAILYRNYTPDFHTFYSNAFSENTKPQNERGLYWGWKFRLDRRYSFTGYFDMFEYPWLGFRRYAPSPGYEWMLRGHYQPSRKASLFLQVRTESKFRNAAEAISIHKVHEGTKRNATLHCDYGIGDRLRMKSRVQYNRYVIDKTLTEGLALLQDITVSLGRLKVTGRHALFDTDHHDNRHYVYEHDAWLAYSLPAYSGVGVRNYALIEYKVHKQLTLWLRYARTRLINTAEIGSGQDVIEGNTKNDVKFQARLRF